MVAMFVARYLDIYVFIVYLTHVGTLALTGEMFLFSLLNSKNTKLIQFRF